MCVISSRTDSKSIMRMKSGQMFAKEDLIRGRKLLHDGALQLKTSAGRLKGSQTSPVHPCNTQTLSFTYTHVLCLFWPVSNISTVYEYVQCVQLRRSSVCLCCRGPCHAAVWCVGLPSRERPEICLRFFGKLHWGLNPVVWRLHVCWVSNQDRICSGRFLFDKYNLSVFRISARPSSLYRIWLSEKLLTRNEVSLLSFLSNAFILLCFSLNHWKHQLKLPWLCFVRCRSVPHHSWYRETRDGGGVGQQQGGA